MIDHATDCRISRKYLFNKTVRGSLVNLGYQESGYVTGQT